MWRAVAGTCKYMRRSDKKDFGCGLQMKVRERNVGLRSCQICFANVQFATDVSILLCILAVPC